MRFYIASSFKNSTLVKELSQKLINYNYEHSYDWTKNQRANSIEDLSTIGMKEKEAIIDSDFIVILLPAGKGSHIELGIALGLEKRIYLYSPNQEIYHFDQTTTFYHVEGVDKFVGTLENFTNYLIQKENNYRLQFLKV